MDIIINKKRNEFIDYKDINDDINDYINNFLYNNNKEDMIIF